MKNSNSTFVLYVFGFFCQATRIQISSSAISLSIHSEPTMAWTKTDKQTNKQAKNTETHTRRSVTRIHSIYFVICDQFSRRIFSSTTKPDTSIRKKASIRTNDRSRCASTKYRKTWMPKITSWTFSTRYEMEKNHTKAKKIVTTFCTWNSIFYFLVPLWLFFSSNFHLLCINANLSYAYVYHWPPPKYT